MDQQFDNQLDADRLVLQTGAIVSAYVKNNPLAAGDLPKLILDTHTALLELASPKPAAAEPPALVPAVSIRKSITPDYLICLDDGKRFKSLKRHLATLGMTPDDYRAKWGLPDDYPMVAPNYSATRSKLALEAGLGSVKSEK